jgi:hypothetical protein
MLSAAVAVTVSLWREASWKEPRLYLLCGYFFLVALVFVYTTIDNMVERPDGAIIASIFIFLLLTASALSRIMRSTEMRVSEASFVDVNSAELWRSMEGKKVNLIPHHTATAEHREALAVKVRKYYNVEGPLAFLHVNLMDNRSDFLAPLRLKASREGEHFLIEAYGAVAVANSVAYLSELLDPISIVMGLTRRDLMRQSFAYIFFGEGETGLLVYSILVRYWEDTKRYSGQPVILLVSESAYHGPGAPPETLNTRDAPAK